MRSESVGAIGLMKKRVVMLCIAVAFECIRALMGATLVIPTKGSSTQSPFGKWLVAVILSILVLNNAHSSNHSSSDRSGSGDALWRLISSCIAISSCDMLSTSEAVGHADSFGNVAPESP